MNNFLNFTNLNVSITEITITQVEQLFVTIVVNLIPALLIFVLYFFAFISLSKKIFSFRNFSYFRTSLVNLVIGVLFSTISPILLSINLQINYEFAVVTQVTIIMAFCLFTSLFVYIGTLPVFFISNFYMVYFQNESTIGLQNLILILVFYVLGGFWTFLNRFFFKNNWKTISLTSTLLFLLMFLVSFLLFGEEFFDIFINLLISYVVFFLFYAIATYIFNLIDETYRLKSSIMYDSDYFVNSGYSEVGFIEYIKKRKIQSGLFLTFDFMNIENILINEGNQFTENLEKNFIKYIFYNFGKDAYYFKTFKNEYGLFIPIDYRKINLKLASLNNAFEKRTDEDFLKQYEIILSGFPTKVDYNGKIYPINIYCFAGIYGVHSCDFYELIANNHNLKNNWDPKSYKNVIKLFTHTEVEDEKLVNAINNVKKNYDYKNLQVSLIECEGNYKRSKVTYLTPKLNWITEDIRSMGSLEYRLWDKQQDLNILVRNISYRSIVLFNQYLLKNSKNGYKICLDYPIQEMLHTKFRINHFLSKFSKNSIIPNDVVIILNVNYSDVRFEENDFYIIGELKKVGFQFALLGVDKTNISSFKNFDYDYLMIDNDFYPEDISDKNKYFKDLKSYFKSLNKNIIER